MCSVQYLPSTGLYLTQHFFWVYKPLKADFILIKLNNLTYTDRKELPASALLWSKHYPREHHINSLICKYPPFDQEKIHLSTSWQDIISTDTRHPTRLRHFVVLSVSFEKASQILMDSSKREKDGGAFHDTSVIVTALRITRVQPQSSDALW